MFTMDFIRQNFLTIPTDRMKNAGIAISTSSGIAFNLSVPPNAVDEIIINKYLLIFINKMKQSFSS